MRELWPAERVPAETVAAVRAEIGPLVEGVLGAVRADSSVYASVLTGPEGVAIRLGVEQAISAFLLAVERGEHPGRDAAELWRRLGEAEFQAGRSLDALRAAFRAGIRAAWRGAAELAVRAGLAPEMVIALAEAIFVYSEELAVDVADGYVRAQSDEAGERERRRRRLATLLVDPAGHDPEAVAHAAELASWPLPREVAVVALDLLPARPPHPDGLLGTDAAGAFLVLGDPAGPGREAELRRGLAGARGALGPAVPLPDARHSLRWARLARALAGGGAIGEASLVVAREHLAELVLGGDTALLGVLERERLGALLELPPAEQARLRETLSAWLDHQRHAPSVAAALHVHPQTVRYRLARLRELLGDALETPAGRFELQLALRARLGSPDA